jgi:hypothetical protein
MIACCGIECSTCEAFLATSRNDDRRRAEVAEKWSKQSGASIRPEQIQCTGCRSDGVKFCCCESMCEIRKCAVEKSLDTCAPCGDFPCGKLDPVFKGAPEARAALESLRPGKAPKRKPRGKKGGAS